MNEYVKMGALVNSQFSVIAVAPYQWKMWSNEEKKMLVSDKYEQGYQKKYRVETDKGILDISSSQLSNMLEGVSKEGKSDVIGKTFSVKSNGKTGIEIRYYLNPVFGAQSSVGLDPELKEKLEAKRDETLYPAQPSAEAVQDMDLNDPINLDDIPF